VATGDLQQLAHAHAGEEAGGFRLGGSRDALDRGLGEVDENGGVPTARRPE
jgi:hypothetical protein